MIKLSLEMIHCYEYVPVSVETFLESTHLPLLLPPEHGVAIKVRRSAIVVAKMLVCVLLIHVSEHGSLS